MGAQSKGSDDGESAMTTTEGSLVPDWESATWEVYCPDDERHFTSGIEFKPNLVPGYRIGGGGTNGEKVRMFTTWIKLSGGVIRSFESTDREIWTIIFTLDSHVESFTVDEETLRKEKADLSEVLSEHLESIRSKRQMDAQQKAKKDASDAKKGAEKGAKYRKRQARRLVELAQVKLRNRVFDGAVESLDEAIKLDPDNKEAIALLARLS